MKNILITSAESQILVSTIYSLRNSFYCKIIGIDRKEESEIAKHLVDVYYFFKGNDESYVKKIQRVCKKHNVNAIIPHSLKDRILIMKHKDKFDSMDIAVLSSSIESIELSDNKSKFAEKCRELDIPLPEQYIVNNARSLLEASKKLGFPEKKILVKPVQGRGSRGLRIINESLNMKKLFYKQRPESYETTMKGLLDVLGKKFSNLIVSEFLPGKEYTVDCMRHDDFFFAMPRYRKKVKNGVTSVGEIFYDETMIEYSRKLSEALDLTTVFGFQFKEDENGNLKILECNPRIQGTMIMTTLAGANIIGTSLKLLWGKKITEFDVDWDMKFIRLSGGISVGEKKQVVSLDPR